jgi:hypothetical protein
MLNFTLTTPQLMDTPATLPGLGSVTQSCSSVKQKL